MAVKEEGAVPVAGRLARVCSLWREVSLDTQLWRTIDLSTYFKEKNRTEFRLKWFIENRMLDSEDINIGFWKVTNTLVVLIKLFENCPGVISLSLAGWRALSADDLDYIAINFTRLARIDLSSINTEMNTSKTCCGPSITNQCN
jgi:F-box and leucine-rich repeat protein 6